MSRLHEIGTDHLEEEGKNADLHQAMRRSGYAGRISDGRTASKRKVLLKRM